MIKKSATIVDQRSVRKYANVLLPLPLSETYTYSIPDHLDICNSINPGDFVRVPFGHREIIGVVWDSPNKFKKLDRIKPVLERLDVPRMPETTIRFVKWVSNYNMVALGLILKMTMNVPGLFKQTREQSIYFISDPMVDYKKTTARSRVLNLFKTNSYLSRSSIRQEAQVSSSVLTGMLELGVLSEKRVPQTREFQEPDWRKKGPKLSTEQSLIARNLEKKIIEGEFFVGLIEGVPGSGKTEVYLEAICEALKRGKQALVLLPEITLSAQWLRRFEKRFGCAPALWHSEVSPANRRKTWQAVARGEAKVIVGARSALFLPFQSIGVIVIDEEHDQSFKQEESVIYNARDMAVVRSRIEKIPIFLVSATPSLETLHNANRGKYSKYCLSQRYAGAKLPYIEILDMRKSKPERGKWISPEIIEALRHTFKSGEQGLLYLNRRGYAPLTLCQDCGHRFQCVKCTAWLVEHRFIGQLQCHHCGYYTPMPKECPNCKSVDRLHACGPGVERLAEEVREIFPDIRMQVAVSDNLNSVGQAGALVKKIEKREVDLIVGTQIIAKGYHFPFLTLVGVIDADIGLAGGDIRALERTYQLLYQVAGRAGRASRFGKVMLQTFNPENMVMQALKNGDHESFVQKMIDDREAHSMPPFGRLAGIILSGNDEKLVKEASNILARTAPMASGIMTLGPAPAPLALLRGKYRIRFLVKSQRDINIQDEIKKWLKKTFIPQKVRVQVDIDPYSFM